MSQLKDWPGFLRYLISSIESIKEARRPIDPNTVIMMAVSFSRKGSCSLCSLDDRFVVMSYIVLHGPVSKALIAVFELSTPSIT